MIFNYNSKKAVFPVIKTIIIILISVIILLTYVILLSSNKIVIDDKKVNTQIIVKKFFESNCFSDKYGIININKINQENIDLCYTGINRVYGRIQFSSKINDLYYIGNQDNFNLKSSLCTYKLNNVLCSKLEYPIILEDELGNRIESTITFFIISEN